MKKLGKKQRFSAAYFKREVTLLLSKRREQATESHVSEKGVCLTSRPLPRAKSMASVYGSKVKEPKLTRRSELPFEKQSPYAAGKSVSNFTRGFTKTVILIETHPLSSNSCYE